MLMVSTILEMKQLLLLPRSNDPPKPNFSLRKFCGDMRQIFVDARVKPVDVLNLLIFLGDEPLFFWKGGGGGMRNLKKNCLQSWKRPNKLFAQFQNKK